MAPVQVTVNSVKALSVNFSLPFPQALNHIYSPQSLSVRCFICIYIFKSLISIGNMSIHGKLKQDLK